MCAELYACVREREKGKGFGLASLIQWKHFRHKKSQLRERKKEREEERNVPGQPPAPLWITAIFVLFCDAKETRKLKPSECFAMLPWQSVVEIFHMWPSLSKRRPRTGFPQHKKNPLETIHLKGWSQKQIHNSHRISFNKTDSHVLIVKNLITSWGLSHIHPQARCILWILVSLTLYLLLKLQFDKLYKNAPATAGGFERKNDCRQFIKALIMP